MTYVLIVIWHGFITRHVASAVGGTTMQEFSSEATCRAAEQFYKDFADSEVWTVRTKCVIK